MPVVELDAARLARLVGGRRTRKAILEALPYLGLDIESADGGAIRVEYSPNRPDYATDYGIAEGLRGALGVSTGAQRIAPKKSASYVIRRSPSVARVRPVVMGLVARRLKLDEHALRQLIAMQEDLHSGLGRNRRTVSMGLHDLDAIKFPLEYTTAARDLKIVPLGSGRELTLDGVLGETDVGRRYAHILEGEARVPVILDAGSGIVSFPPVINSAHTAVTARTREVLVEITGTDARQVENAISIVASTLKAAGSELYEVCIAGGPSARLAPRKMTLRSSLVADTLGIKMKPAQIVSCLRRSRLDASASGTRISCVVPRHRFDILGEMDLVEEAALGYGINNIEPALPPQDHAGEKSRESAVSDSVSACMIGLGYTEALNSALISGESAEGLGRNRTSEMLAVMESQSRSSTILRDSLIPGLLDVVSRNVHEAYPQKIYETGTVFARARPVEERTMLAAVVAHKGANYTEAKSAATSTILRCFGAKITTTAAEHPALEAGHAAEIAVNGAHVGIVGDVSPGILERLRIREHTAVFEVDLTALLKTNPGAI